MSRLRRGAVSVALPGVQVVAMDGQQAESTLWVRLLRVVDDVRS